MWLSALLLTVNVVMFYCISEISEPPKRNTDETC